MVKLRRRQGASENSGNLPKAAIEGQLTDAFQSIEGGGRQLPTGTEDAEGNGEIEAPSLFGEIRGREIDDNAPRWELEAAVLDGCSHPVTRLAHGRLGQADDGKGRQTGAEIAFYQHLRRTNADGGATAHQS
jgi:hypothetical protein